MKPFVVRSGPWAGVTLAAIAAHERGLRWFHWILADDQPRRDPAHSDHDIYVAAREFVAEEPDLLRGLARWHDTQKERSIERTREQAQAAREANRRNHELREQLMEERSKPGHAERILREEYARGEIGWREWRVNDETARALAIVDALTRMADALETGSLAQARREEAFTELIEYVRANLNLNPNGGRNADDASS